MSNSHRRSVAKKIKEQIDVATDPMVIAELSRQLSKFLPRPKNRRGGSLPSEGPSMKGLMGKRGGPRKDQIGLFVATDTAVDELPDGGKLTHRLVTQVEAKCRGRGGWLKLSRAEKDALIAEVTATLSPQERAAIEAYGMGETNV